MAEEEPIIKIPKRNHESLFPTGPLSKSVPTSFYSRREPPPAPRHRPLRSKKEPESFQLPPPSPLDDHKIKENLLLGRSLTKTTPAQLLYPSSVPSRFPAKRLRDLSLTPKKPDILQDDLEASPSWTRNSCEFRSINLDKRDPFSFSSYDCADSDTEEYKQTQETERTPERQKQRRSEEDELPALCEKALTLNVQTDLKLKRTASAI